jgi:hypothetical protein
VSVIVSIQKMRLIPLAAKCWNGTWNRQSGMRRGDQAIQHHAGTAGPACGKMGEVMARRKLDPATRRALNLLAGLPEGATTETVLLGHGWTAKLIAELVEAGLVRTTSGRPMTWVHITEAGRRAIDG